jgi:hypothetical protein
MKNPQPGRREGISPPKVSFPLCAPQMVCAAVDFDDNTVTVVEEIDAGDETLIRDAMLPRRHRKVVAAKELKEPRLERTLCRWNRATPVENRTQNRRRTTSPAFERLETPKEPVDCRHSPTQRGLQRKLDQISTSHRTQIYQCAVHCRDRDSFQPRGIAAIDSAEVTNRGIAQISRRANEYAVRLKPVESP